MTKTVRTKISEKRLRDLVLDEIKSLHEEVDHEGVKTVVNAASKMLKAVSTFEKDANIAMTNSLTPGLEHLKAALEAMIDRPSSYIDRPATAKTIKLRQVSDED